jgi:prefoldin subunit 5
MSWVSDIDTVRAIKWFKEKIDQATNKFTQIQTKLDELEQRINDLEGNP